MAQRNQTTLDKLGERGDHFDTVYLVVTNQPEGVDEKHRRNDTISAAKLIVRLIKERKLFENAHFDCDEGFASDEICAVLNHADKRSQFDWKAAVQAIDGFTQTDSQMQQWHESANHKNTRDRLREVVDCAELAFRRSHWRDFIVLIDTFVENAWRILAEEVLGRSLFEP